MLSDSTGNPSDPRVFDASRYARPDLGIALKPSFRLGPDSRVFVLGNCFANQVEMKLADAGVRADGGGLGPVYCIECAYQAAKWALRGGFDERHIIRVDRGGSPLWFNPHRAPETTHASLEEAVGAYRESLCRVGKGLREADVLIVVLGVVEHFVDRQTKAAMNCLPQEFWSLRRSGRAESKRDRHADVVGGGLSLAFEVLAVNPGVRMIWGVSPITQDATIVGSDVLVANGYCKATLRSAVEEIVEQLRARGVMADYFPFYELGTLNPREKVFKEEFLGKAYGRMVRGRFVRDIVTPMLLDAYAPERRVARTAAAEAQNAERVPGGSLAGKDS